MVETLAKMRTHGHIFRTNGDFWTVRGEFVWRAGPTVIRALVQRGLIVECARDARGFVNEYELADE